MASKDKKAPIISNFEVKVRCNRSDDGSTVLGWSGWFFKNKYLSQLPIKNGEIMDMKIKMPDSHWEADQDTNVTFVVDNDFVTIESKHEHTLRIAFNYLLSAMIEPKKADVKLRRTWHFNIYEDVPDTESVMSGPIGIFDDNDDF
jgi:hypothetical protein